DNGDEQQLAPSGFNYGHGQAGHLPDVSGLVFEYSPEWDKQLRLKRNNPKEFSEAFLDLVKMFKRLRTGRDFHVSFGEKKSYEDKIFVPNEVYEVISKYRRFGRKQDGVFHKVALDWQNLFYSSNFNFKPYSGNYDWEEGFKKEWMEGTEHNHKEVVVSETCSYMRFQYALCHHVDWAINALNRKVSVTNKPMSKYIDEGENYVKSRKIRKHCCDRLDLADFELPGGIYSIEPAAARGKFLQLSTDSNAPLDRPLLRLVPEEPHRWFIKQSPNHDGYYRLFNKDQQGFSLDALKANEDSSAPVEFGNVDYSSEDQLWKIKVINRDNNGVTAFLINKASGKAFCYQEHGPTQLTLEEIPNEAAKFNIQFFPGEHIPEKTGALLDGIF
ncbi:MAG: hypothetical protein KZQ86_20655, partial [Candidatus Thiodiazotropha sp. (ex Lucinoma kastoroae)]|nr:hypothetical protein [Candidatus Thiodiazotropha sp. (ex Lucinoma kastoroae)]